MSASPPSVSPTPPRPVLRRRSLARRHPRNALARTLLAYEAPVVPRLGGVTVRPHDLPLEDGSLCGLLNLCCVLYIGADSRATRSAWNRPITELFSSRAENFASSARLTPSQSRRLVLIAVQTRARDPPIGSQRHKPTRASLKMPPRRADADSRGAAARCSALLDVEAIAGSKPACSLRHRQIGSFRRQRSPPTTQAQRGVPPHVGSDPLTHQVRSTEPVASRSSRSQSSATLPAIPPVASSGR